jgi:hypothetical protein
MPAQPTLDGGPLPHQVLAMVNQQPQLPGGPSNWATGKRSSRKTARATARASMGSDFPGLCCVGRWLVRARLEG